jgi:penicillin amidase
MKFIIKFICVFSLIFFLFIQYLNYSTTTPKNGIISLVGLKGKVTIFRDTYGIPHIIAEKNDADAFFALGYIHAQDRFWQMEFQRRVAQGTLSEIFGKAALQKDIYLRTWGFYHAAEKAWPAFDANTKLLLSSYTKGVNAFLLQGKLPLQFKFLHYQPKPWTEIDSICWQKMMAYNLQFTWYEKVKNDLIQQKLDNNQILILKPPYPSNGPTIINTSELNESHIPIRHIDTIRNVTFSNSHDPITKKPPAGEDIVDPASRAGLGSNSWVVNGHLSATGKPLLANDPHLALNAPALWYLVELKGPHIHLTGATIPGLPAVVIGHNDQIAWGITNANPDSQDLYIEPNTAHFKNQLEIIKVKNEPDVMLYVQSSQHGPIISDISEAGKIASRIAIKWTALAPGDTTVQSFLKINYATNWPTFVKALQDYKVPSQNFIYADKEGNIGYYLAGTIPIRKDWNGSLPITKNNVREWDGYIPFDQLPHVYNPLKGYIATANNKIIPDDYAYSLTFRWSEPPYRIKRIIDLLKANQLSTISNFKNIQLDTYSNLWDDLKPVLLTTKPLNKNSQLLLSILKNWDGNYDLNSIGATVFSFWYKQLLKLSDSRIVFSSYLEEPLFIKQQLKFDSPYCKSNNANNCNDFLSQSLDMASQELIHIFGEDYKRWQWKNIHRVTVTELGIGLSKLVGWIWNRTISTPGGLYTVSVGTYNLGTYQQTDGSGYRQIIDLSHFDNSLYIQMLGQDDNPFSRHHGDFLSLWRDGKYVKISANSSAWGKTERLILIPVNPRNF